MSDRIYRPSYVNVDLDAINDNFKAVGRLHPNKTVIAVVKANGYGLGAVQIATHLYNQGTEFFAVATLDEAIELRMHGIKAKILVLGIIEPKDIHKASQHRLALTVPGIAWLQEAIEFLEDDDKPFWIHLKLDTGMGRIGMRDSAEYQQVIEEIQQQDKMIFEGVYTHFSCADEENNSAEIAYNKFIEIVNTSEKPPFIHCQNSAAALRFDASACTAIRLGISLYGYYPSEFIKNISKLQLKPAMQLVSTVNFIKDVKVGDTVSYGETYVAQADETIATFPLGYADGLNRKLQGYQINLAGTDVEIVGRICMDQFLARVPEGTEVGTQAIIIDHYLESNQSIERVANQLDTINYEVLTSLSRRLPKCYITGDDIDKYNELLK
ncbi:alanine racemase [Macrococcus sp. EM39E]|uniref:alanine racemase n=1 Tax=Macrococcus animalis TaxID=3395467 RepID=UPI0039BF85F4